LLEGAYVQYSLNFEQKNEQVVSACSRWGCSYVQKRVNDFLVDTRESSCQFLGNVEFAHATIHMQGVKVVLQTSSHGEPPCSEVNNFKLQ